MIEVAGLARRRGPRNVVDDLTFSVGRGEIVGLIGVNGAGKTSAIECLAGLARPDAGTIRVDGHAPGSVLARAVTGVVLQQSGLPSRLTILETLELFASLYAVSPDHGLVASLGLSAIARQRTDRLSGGQRQRLSLALALQHAPQVLLLDEPATALDLTMRRDLARLLEQRRDDGAAILMATHDLTEATSLCDRVLLLSGGRLVAQGKPADLIAGSGAPSCITMTTAIPLPGEAGDTIIRKTRDVATCLTALLARAGQIPVVKLTVTAATLADVVLAFEKGDHGDD